MVCNGAIEREALAANGIVDLGETGQVMFFLRPLSGKLHESRVMLEKLASDTEVKERHRLDSNGTAAASLKLVCRHFKLWVALLCDIETRGSTHTTSSDTLSVRSRRYQPLSPGTSSAANRHQ